MFSALLYLEGHILKFEAFSGLGLEFLPLRTRILKFTFWEVCDWNFSARLDFRRREGCSGSVGNCR